MSATLRQTKRNIHKYSDYKVLKKELSDLPGEMKDYVTKNFTAGEAAQMGLDIVGIFEPTPFADIAGTILGLARGDWASAGASAAGILPYLGDTGKVAKWATRALTDKRYAVIMKGVNRYMQARRKLKALAQSKALTKTKKEMWEYYQRHKRGDNCELCKKAGKKIKLPTHGKWKPGPPGENGSKWFPDEASGMSEGMQKLVNEKGGIPFSDGMPDYKDFATELPPPGSGMKTLPFEMNGKGSDITGSFKEYRDMMEANGSPLSDEAFEALNQSHTWHHTDAGMQLVPKGLHNPSLGGASHVGARSWLSWPNY